MPDSDPRLRRRTAPATTDGGPVPAPTTGARRSAPDINTGPGGRRHRADSLAPELARVVLNTPGVVRLEPTLKDAVRRLTRRARAGTAGGGPPPGPTGGIRITSHAGSVNAIIDIAVTNTSSALSTARAVQSAALDTLYVASAQAPTVTVNVLSIEEVLTPTAASGSDPADAGPAAG